MTKNLKRRRRLTVLFILMLIASAIGWGLSEIRQVEALNVKTIRISGAHYTPLAPLQTLTSSVKGQPLLRVMIKGKLRKKILATFPQIEEVKVRLLFPSVLTITLKEKKPFVGFIQPNGETEIHSVDGSFLERTPLGATPNAQLLVSGIPRRLQWPKTAAWVSKKLVQVNDALATSPLFAHAIVHFQSICPEIHNSTKFEKNQDFSLSTITDCSGLDDEIVVLKDGHLPIKMGGLDHFLTKIEAMTIYWKQHTELSSSRNIEYVDVRIQDRVVVKYVP